MVKEDLTNSPPDPSSNNELNKKNFTYYYIIILERVPGEYVKKVLSNYSRGTLAPQVIAYILDHGGFTIPTLSTLFDAPRQTIDYILRGLNPWISQTDVKIEHPLKKPGNKPYVWIREGIEVLEGVKEARANYYSTLMKYDPAVKKREDQKEELGRSFMKDVVRNNSETYLKDILTYLRGKGIGGTLRRDLANMIAEFVKESGVKVWG